MIVIEDHLFMTLVCSNDSKLIVIAIQTYIYFICYVWYIKYCNIVPIIIYVLQFAEEKTCINQFK